MRLLRTLGYGFGSAVVTALVLSACSAVLGIEDVNSGSGDDAGRGSEGDGGGDSGGRDGASGGDQGSKGGSTASGGRTGGGGTTPGNGGGQAAGGATGTGGGQGGASGGSSSVDGGAGGSGEGGAAGGSGSGGAPEAGSPTVHGKILDYWGHVIPNVLVEIGDVNVVTEADGEFTIEDVAGTYDLKLTVNTRFNNSPASFGWLFQGLTRRDPTLQIYRGLEERGGTINYHVTGETFPLADGRVIQAAFHGPDGDHQTELDYEEDSSYPYWVGPEATSGAVHALLFEEDATGLPTKYFAHDSQTVAVDQVTDADVTFDLAHPGAQLLPSAAISGSITRAATSDNRNLAFLRFADGSALQLFEHYDGPNAFTYVVPTVANGSIALFASISDPYYPPYAIAVADNVAAGQAGIELTVPGSPTLTAPANGASNIKIGSNFRWGGTGGVTILAMECFTRWDRLFVVTAKKAATMPDFPASSFAIPADDDCEWWVEYHGSSATTVDEVTGPGGQLSPYAFGYPRTKTRGNGIYSESEHFGFHSAP